MKLSLLLPAFILASPIMASPIPGEGHSVDLASLTMDELIAVFDKIAPLVVTDAVLSRRQTLPKAPHEEEFDCVRHCIIEWCGTFTGGPGDFGIGAAGCAAYCGFVAC